METILSTWVAPVAVAVITSWIMLSRRIVTRQEVSDMILKEAPLATKDDLELIRQEISKLNVNVAKLAGVLEVLVKGK